MTSWPAPMPSSRCTAPPSSSVDGRNVPSSRDRPCSRSASTRRWPTTSPRRCSTASTATTGCSAPSRRAPSTASRPPTGTASSGRSASASSSTTCACEEAVHAAGEGIQGRRAADGRLAAGQAALHRPADRPPPARAGRDLLQLGHHQDPAPHATSTTTSSSCARRSAPSTSRTTSRRPRRPTAPTTPRARRCARPSCASSTTSSCSAPSRTSTRDARPGARGDERAPGAGQAARQLPDPGAVVAVLPQQGRLRGRQDHQRLQRAAVRAADPAQPGAASW